MLLNLIGNGFYAASKRGRENDGSLRPALKVVTREFGESVEIRVRDNGIGIPPEVQRETVPAVLHNQADRRRYRTWPVDKLRDHNPAARRHDHGR